MIGCGPVPFVRPMICTWTALSLIPGLNYEEEVLALVEDGRLQFAWDMGGRDAEARLVRIYAESLNDYLAGRSAPEERGDEMGRMVSAMFGPGRAEVPAAEVSKCWNISSGHVLNLIRRGTLPVVKGSRIKPGPNGSPRISTAVLAGFLEKRRIV